MAFNPSVKAKIVKDSAGQYIPCVMCGRSFPPPDAAHIVGEEEWVQKIGTDSQVNGLPLCKTCHTVFDDYLRSRLYAALKEFGTTGLPKSWEVSPKKQLKE
jgi:hypothetical protein